MKQSINIRCTQHVLQLVEKLFAEARLLPVHRKLVSEGKLSRFQRSVPRSNQSAIFSMWDQYTRKEIITKRLMPSWSAFFLLRRRCNPSTSVLVLVGRPTRSMWIWCTCCCWSTFSLCNVPVSVRRGQLFLLLTSRRQVGCGPLVEMTQDLSKIKQ
jgi:hypothetical protein